MDKRKKILVVEDSLTSRKVICDILESEYIITAVCNGKEALEALDEANGEYDAIILDLVMPVMDGYTLLEMLAKNEIYKNIPTIVETAEDDSDSEKRALRLGAWDLIQKPIDGIILQFRLRNAIERSQMAAFMKLKYIAEYDELTDIYNKKKCFMDTQRMIRRNKDVRFAFVRFDINRFQLINSFYGVIEGDNLLRYIAGYLKDNLKSEELATYGRIASDIFVFCIPFDKEKLEAFINEFRIYIEKYNDAFDIVPAFGIYVTKDTDIEISHIYDCASLAAKKIKGNYLDIFSYYTQSLSDELEKEQEITNDMAVALDNNQFDVYYQPKYNILNNTLCGAEALVRWHHPQKGEINPSDFTPLFERNGFITKVDYFIWEKVCISIRKWLDEGYEVKPISVNVSRVNMYNPNICKKIISLVEKYSIPAELIGLELTESAYMDNPVAMRDTIRTLRDYGFTILMDDFGSGYSSLNVLKDIEVDVLKIDMNFLSETDIQGRGENIIASVIRMAKWLRIPVIVEGVETYEQVKFLKSIGCEYVQGFYYAKPLKKAAYEELMNNCVSSSSKIESGEQTVNLDSIFNSSPQMELMFSGLGQAIALYECDGRNVDIIRVNEGYYDLFNIVDDCHEFENVFEYVKEEYRSKVLDTFVKVCNNKDRAECEYIRKSDGGRPEWYLLKIKYIYDVSGCFVLIGTHENITAIKEIDMELSRYKAAIEGASKNVPTMLIVDDVNVDRRILGDIFADSYNILKANDGEEAIRIISEAQVDIVLLDLVMPRMDGKAFLEHRIKNTSLYSIPVIIITGDDRPEEQLLLMSYGISDYIVKPFVPEVIKKRVDNVMTANMHLKDIVKRYTGVTSGARIDHTTEVYNRQTTIHLIDELLRDSVNNSHALIIINISNYEELTKENGHAVVDVVMNKCADEIKRLFRTNDIIGRISVDEFVVCMYGITDIAIAINKARLIKKNIMNDTASDKCHVTCHCKVAMAPEHGTSFAKVYENAVSTEVN